jgi:hypothetical protein
VPSDYSRSLLLAQQATGRDASELERTLSAGKVTVSIDPDMPTALLTAQVLLTTLRRGPGQLILERGSVPNPWIEEIASAVTAVDPEQPLTITRSCSDTTVRLHIGADHSYAIRVVPDGYGAHVVGDQAVVIAPARAANQLGAIYAAALGAAEIFKRTAQVLPARRVTHRYLRFCPVTLSSDLTAAPLLSSPLILDLTQIGIGAIGTATILLLQAMRAEGRLIAVDHQRFGPENRGTYSLGGAAEVAAAPWKADMASQALPLFDVTPFRRPVSELPAAIDTGDVPWFPLVLTALDTAAARRDAQRLWPDRLIDAGTGDTMLGIHDHEHNRGPCLICLFSESRSGPSAAERLAEVTGLSVERATRGDAPLTEEDLAQLGVEQQLRLLPYLGKPVCGLAQAVGLTSLSAGGYQPSIPFVSVQAACLAVGRLIARQLDLRPAGNLVQYDGLIGPQAIITEEMRQRPDCVCRTRAATIEEVRYRRRTGTAAHRIDLSDSDSSQPDS